MKFPAKVFVGIERDNDVRFLSATKHAEELLMDTTTRKIAEYKLVQIYNASTTTKLKKTKIQGG